VVPDEAELRRLRQVAKSKGLTLSEWVRQTLRRASRGEPGVSSAKQLAVVRAAALHGFPAPGIDTMLDEIERGYLGSSRT
jgi:hypothetical protein